MQCCGPPIHRRQSHSHDISRPCDALRNIGIDADKSRETFFHSFLEVCARALVGQVGRDIDVIELVEGTGESIKTGKDAAYKANISAFFPKVSVDLAKLIYGNLKRERQAFQSVTTINETSMSHEVYRSGVFHHSCAYLIWGPYRFLG